MEYQGAIKENMFQVVEKFMKKKTHLSQAILLKNCIVRNN